MVKKGSFSSKQFFSFFFTILFLTIIGIVIIFIAEQYTIKDGQVIQTGMIEIREIRDATVFVNDEEVGKSPAVASYLEEGEYTVKLTKEGRADWERNIKVTPGKVVTLFPILLPENTDFSGIDSVEKAIKTDSLANYFEVELEGDSVILNRYEVNQGIFGISTDKSAIADLSVLSNDLTEDQDSSSNPDSETIPTENTPQNQEEELTPAEIADSFDYWPSNEAKFVVLRHIPTNSYFLAGNGHKEPLPISSWLSLEINKFMWAQDENTAIITSGNMLISVNMRNGQTVILHNITKIPPENINANKISYGNILPLKDTVLFSLNYNDNKKLSRLYSIRLDGTSLEEIPTKESESPEPWDRITNLNFIDARGILLVETENAIYEISADEDLPKKIVEDHSLLYSDQQDETTLTCDKNAKNSGLVIHYNPATVYPRYDITYPIGCNEIQAIDTINGGQNIILKTQKTLYIISSDGSNVHTLYQSDHQEFQLLVSKYYRRTLFVRLALTGQDEDGEDLLEFQLEN